MYSNDVTQIRAGMINYIGALVNSSIYGNEEATRHSVVAALSEEISDLCKNENDEYDMFICKPTFRLISNIFKQRLAKLKELPQVKTVKEQIKTYEFMILEIEKIIEQTQYERRDADGKS